jgi:hypothetical protein
MASWAKLDGSIGTETVTTLWPGKVLYYFTHQCTTDGSYKKYLFAAVYWYSEHFRRSLYGKPLEIWKDEHIPEGPAMFLPIHKLECQCVVARSTIPVPNAWMKTTPFHCLVVQNKELFLCRLYLVKILLILFHITS